MMVVDATKGVRNFNDFMDVANRKVTVGGIDFFFRNNFHADPRAVIADDNSATIIDVAGDIDNTSDVFDFIGAVMRKADMFGWRTIKKGTL